MRIIVTNDDGIGARGLMALYRALESLGEVYVIAPDRERSACSHKITVHDILRAEKVEYGWAVTGTPADCVKMGLDALLPGPPDLIVSGINEGANLGTDVMYSGTVAAALEGAIAGIPSLAVSVAAVKVKDFTYAARFARRLCQLVVQKGLPRGTALNVNIPDVPAEEIAGVEVTRLSWRRYINSVHRQRDPRGRDYFWLAGESIEVEPRSGSDLDCIRAKKISITPIHFDLTNERAMAEIVSWKLAEQVSDPGQASQVPAGQAAGEE